MGSSNCRKYSRLAWSEIRKSKPIRRRGNDRGGCGGVVYGLLHSSLKADKGAEKSCLRKRRKRGLRKGKLRSRGRHPRRTVTAAISSEVSSRTIRHHLRMAEHLRPIGPRFWEKVGRQQNWGMLRDRSRGYYDLAEWFDRRVRRLKSVYPPLLIDSILCGTFSRFVESHGIRQRPIAYRTGAEPTGEQSLASLMSHLSSNLPRREQDRGVNPRSQGRDTRVHRNFGGRPRPPFCVECGGHRSFPVGRMCRRCYLRIHNLSDTVVVGELPPPYRP